MTKMALSKGNPLPDPFGHKKRLIDDEYLNKKEALCGWIGTFYQFLPEPGKSVYLQPLTKFLL